MTRAICALVGAMALVLTGCSSAATSESSQATTISDDLSSAQASIEAQSTGPSNDGAVPNPCTLLSVDDLVRITGTDPGAGSPDAVDPDVRRVCRFDSGLVVGVELGDDGQAVSTYETAIKLIRANATDATNAEISGVGERAFMSDYGTIRQVVALEGRYVVDVAGGLSADQAKDLASQLLAALG